MTAQTRQSGVWRLVRRQHGVVTRAQLLELGLTAHAIRHRVAKGRLHPVARGVYAVGRPELTQHGTWMAAVLRCGPHAVLSHESAAQLWEIRKRGGGRIEVSVPGGGGRRVPGVVLHRRVSVDAVRHHGIPVTGPITTLIDMAPRLATGDIEAAVNEADKRDLCDPEALRAALDAYAGWPGVGKLKRVLDRRTFALTDSELERRFLPLARSAGLPQPLTGQRVDGFKVDFYWPDLRLVVETDGLRYHRTAAQQTADRIRDQAHVAAGLTALRFTHAQVAFEAGWVRATLASVADRQVTLAGGPENARWSPRSSSPRTRAIAS